MSDIGVNKVVNYEHNRLEKEKGVVKNSFVNDVFTAFHTEHTCFSTRY